MRPVDNFRLKRLRRYYVYKILIAHKFFWDSSGDTPTGARFYYSYAHRLRARGSDVG